MDDDLSALHRLIAGDESGLSELMARYREPVFRLAWRYLDNAADAQEITEETFVRVFFHADRFRPRAGVKSWVFTIAANLSRDALRRRRKHQGLRSLSERATDGSEPTLDRDLPDPGRDAAATVAGEEHLKEIRKAIAELPEKLRFPFVFCVLEAHSYEEAAEVLGTSIKAVEMRIYRARKELQQRISR